MQKAFDKMRLLMAANALAAYPDHNKRFDVYVGYHTRKIPLPVITLTVPVMLPVRVRSAACTGTVDPFYYSF